MRKNTWLTIVKLYGWDTAKAERAFDDPKRRDQIERYFRSSTDEVQLEKAMSAISGSEWTEEARKLLKPVSSFAIKGLLEASPCDNGLGLVRHMLDEGETWGSEEELQVILFVAENLLKDRQLASMIRKALKGLSECRFALAAAVQYVYYAK